MRRLTPLIVPSLILILVTGCGSDSPTGMSTPQRAEVSVMPGSGVPGCEEIGECYSPSVVTVRAGAEVVWTNDDTAAHTITSGTAGEGPSGAFDSSLIMSGASFTAKLEKPGTYAYFCMVHPWMTGSVVVTE